MGPTSIDRYIRSIVCHYQWDSCTGTLLRVIYFCSRLWQEVRCSVTMGNWQAYSGDTPLHPSQRNSSHKHPLVKWCWLCSLTSRDPCFWTLYHVMAQSLWSLQRMFTNIKNKYLGRLNYPVTQQCPSWWPTRHHTVEGAQPFCIHPGLSL